MRSVVIYELLSTRLIWGINEKSVIKKSGKEN